MNIHFEPKNLKEIWVKWLMPLKYREISMVVSYPGNDHKRRLKQLVEDTTFAQTQLGLEKKPIWQEVDYRKEKWKSGAELENKLQINCEENSIVVMHGVEDMLIDQRKDLILELYDLYRNANLRILLFCENNYFDRNYQNLIWSIPSFEPRIVYHGIYDQDTAFDFVEYLKQKWEMKDLHWSGEELVRSYGCHTGMLKEAVWILRNNPEMDIYSLADSTELVWQLHSLWRRLTKDDREVLTYIAYGLTPCEESIMSREYLMKVGFLSQNGEITIPALLKFIKANVSDPKEMKIRGESIVIEGRDYSNHFTDAQRKILKELILNKGRTIERGTLLDLLDGSGNMSDWALDSHLSRLRARLEEVGLGGNRIKTIKGRGVIWQ